MVATKKRFHKTDKVQGFHLVQSFAEGEVSPELAHLIGVELAERLLRGQFEVVITTHLNTSHFHNHLVWNSVSMEDGHKYHSNEQSYYMEVRKISDELCRKYGLSVIQTNQKKGIHYVQWKAEKEGKPTWRTAIRSDIRETVKASYSWTQFVKEMETRGYVWRTDRKYLALKAPGMERYVRLRSLGKGYGEMEIREWILRPKIRETEKVYLQWSKQRKKRTGLQALYYSYLYQMGVFQKKPKRIPYEVREDIRRLDQRIAQIEFLQKQDISTLEQLQEFRHPLEEKMAQLLLERGQLYRSQPGCERIGKITEEMKQIRNRVNAQAFCATYILGKRYGVDVSGFDLEKVAGIQEHGQKDPQELRLFLNDVRTAAYGIRGHIERNLREPEQQFVTEDTFTVGESEKKSPDKGKKSKNEPER